MPVLPNRPRAGGIEHKNLATFKTLKEAQLIAGKLGKPSKMPGYAYGLPARACPVGAALVKIKGSVCAGCYALKGNYTFPKVQAALEYRLASLTHPQWSDAMVWMIKRRACTYFRWHDSGDIQGLEHLKKIVEVARRCPRVKFWIPTRESRIVKKYLSDIGAFPKNLTVRLSSAMIDGPAPLNYPNTSTVVRDGSQTCPAYTQGGVCGDCRACWDRRVKNVSYPKH